jgi:hypothetical protein
MSASSSSSDEDDDGRKDEPAMSMPLLKIEKDVMKDHDSDDDDDDDDDEQDVENEDSKNVDEIKLVRVLRPVDARGNAHPRYNIRCAAMCNKWLICGVQKAHDERSFLVAFDYERDDMISVHPDPALQDRPVAMSVDEDRQRVFVVDRGHGLRYFDLSLTDKEKEKAKEKSASSSSSSSSSAVIEEFEHYEVVCARDALEETFSRAKGTLKGVKMPHVRNTLSECITVDVCFPMRRFVLVASAHWNELRLFSYEHRALVGLYAGHRKPVACATSFVLREDGKRMRYLLAGGEDRRICMWNFRSMELLRKIKGHRHTVFFVHWWHDRIYSGSMESARVWDRRGTPLKTVRFARPLCMTVMLCRRGVMYCALSNGDIHVYSSAAVLLAVLSCGDTDANDEALPGDRRHAAHAAAATAAAANHETPSKVSARRCRVTSMVFARRHQSLLAVVAGRAAIFEFAIGGINKLVADSQNDNYEPLRIVAPPLTSVTAQANQKCLVM